MRGNIQSQREFLEELFPASMRPPHNAGEYVDADHEVDVTSELQ